MTFNSKKEALEYMQRNGVDISTLNDEFWQSVNISSAQPEFQVIAEMLYDLYREADWVESKHHIPFEKEIVEQYGFDTLSNQPAYDYETLLGYISASMCAKLSYNTQDNIDTVEKHLERANMLLEHKHWEPFSHQAVAMTDLEARALISTKVMSKDKYDAQKHLLGNHTMIKSTTDDTMVYVMLLGVAYNLRGFMSQRYKLENL